LGAILPLRPRRAAKLQSARGRESRSPARRVRPRRGLRRSDLEALHRTGHGAMLEGPRLHARHDESEPGRLHCGLRRPRRHSRRLADRQHPDDRVHGERRHGQLDRGRLPLARPQEPAAAHVGHHVDEPERRSRLDDHAQAGRAGHRPTLPRALDRLSLMAEYGTMRVKSGLAEMLKGGVIMDVVNAEHAKIAEAAGAVAAMALERVPADIRVEGGVARMSDPEMIQEIQESVTIPVMAKCRIGDFVEAQILQALEIDYIDESEVLTPADLEHHVDKWKFTVPFVCGATNLGEALRRIGEGAAMIRTKGEAGTGDIVNAVTHMRSVFGNIRKLTSLAGEELYSEAKKLQAPYELVRWVAEHGRLPVVTFTAGGIATPADAALCMQLGADGVFVGSGIFKSGNPEQRAKAIVEATTHYQDPEILARVSRGLGEAMVGISTASLDPGELLETRGW